MTPTEIYKAIPVMETKRLRLRGHKRSDFPEFAKMRADEKVMRFITKKPLSEAEAWGKFLGCLGLWANLGYGYWVIAEKETDRYIGEAGFGDFYREIKPSIKGVPEAGWVLASHAHGKGIATEALRAVMAWGDENFKDPRTVCIVDEGNPASVRIAEKMGYKKFTTSTYHGDEVMMMERFRA